eukprot:TRINITY_DN9047_c0_g1_i1.p1 TRINITY_DN9047_c0_g1~~TRINITY_DN9047_c0_g1_i1.p1  ORF type:complete len:214 (+),score=61.46 TRINITY_DN9047_c0_g1_i1:52-642(+)
MKLHKLMSGVLRQQTRWYGLDSREIGRTKRKRHGYRGDEKLINIIKKEARGSQWDEDMVSECERIMERSTLNLSSEDGIPGRNYYGTEPRSHKLRFTLSEFVEMTPSERVGLGLPEKVFNKLLMLFIPHQSWQFERTPEEQHNLRLQQWKRFQPESPGSKYSMNDYKEMLPAADYELVDHLRQHPPKGAMPTGWPV